MTKNWKKRSTEEEVEELSKDVKAIRRKMRRTRIT